MSYNTKTLIIFDTNMLRNTEAGEVAYSSFVFGKAYDLIDQFVKENKLEQDVTLAVSTMVITELKHQKQRQYNKDIQQLKDIAKRLSGLPHISEGAISIPDENFDCAAYIEQQAQHYIQTNHIHTLEYRDEHASSMLKNMLAKVVGHEPGKSPFARSGKFNDAGFKDSVIWETLMHYEKIPGYDKVIFLSKDGDYQENCIDDFKTKWQRHISIEKNENNVIYQLKKDYQNYIEYRLYYDYSEKEYFQTYLEQQLNSKTYIQLDGEELKIENYKIANYCEQVEKKLNEEAQEEEFIIHATVHIATTRNGSKENIPVDAQVLMNEVLEIYEITYGPEIY